MLSLKGSAGISGILIALLAGCHFGLPEDNAQGVAFKASAEDIGQWKAVNAKAERRGSYCVISKDASAPIYGRLDSPPLKADINKYPYLTICVDHDQNVAHGWSLALNNKTPLSGNQFTAGKGIVTYDLRGKAPWKEGENSFSLSLYVVGKDKAIRVKWIALAASPQKDCLVLTGNEGKCGFALFPAEPFTPTNGEVAPEIDGAGRAMQVQGCAGEFEPGTFMIYAGRDLNALKVTASDLAGSGKNVIPAANIDVRIVKNWYQGGSGARFSEAVNVPELLLKDDGILYADTTRRKNVLNFKGLPQDGPELKPFSIGKGESKQVWLTIKIPDGVASGSYVGKVKVEAASGAASDISLQVEVLPFALADSGKILGIYTWSPRVYSYAEGREALKEEMRELKRHGFNASTIMYYDPEFKVNSDGGYSVNVDSMKEEIDARMEAGLDKMIVVAFASHKYDFMRRLWNGEKNPATEEDKRKLGFIVKTLDQWAKAHGFPAIYYYGIDEPTQENRAKCKELFETIHAVGGKTYTAVFPQAAEYLGATPGLGQLHRIRR